MITGEATPGEIIKRRNRHPNFGSEDQKFETSCDVENTAEHCVLLCLQPKQPLIKEKHHDGEPQA